LFQIVKAIAGGILSDAGKREVRVTLNEIFECSVVSHSGNECLSFDGKCTAVQSDNRIRRGSSEPQQGVWTCYAFYSDRRNLDGSSVPHALDERNQPALNEMTVFGPMTGPTDHLSFHEFMKTQFWQQSLK
jgi:hypothetical protein